MLHNFQGLLQKLRLTVWSFLQYLSSFFLGNCTLVSSVVEYCDPVGASSLHV